MFIISIEHVEKVKAMSAANSRVELEIREVRLRENAVKAGWFASVQIVATDVDGRTAQGWIHVSKQGPVLKIDGYDEHDDVIPGLIGYVIATRGDAILEAVEAKAAELKLAA